MSVMPDSELVPLPHAAMGVRREQERRAALYVATRAPREHVPELLEALGLVPYPQRRAPVREVRVRAGREGRRPHQPLDEKTAARAVALYRAGGRNLKQVGRELRVSPERVSLALHAAGLLCARTTTTEQENEVSA